MVRPGMSLWICVSSLTHTLGTLTLTLQSPLCGSSCAAAADDVDVNDGDAVGDRLKVRILLVRNSKGI